MLLFLATKLRCVSKKLDGYFISDDVSDAVIIINGVTDDVLFSR